MADADVLSPFARTVFQIRRTALEMLHDRGYTVDAGELNKTEEAFALQFDPETYQVTSGYMVAFSGRIHPGGADDTDRQKTPDDIAVFHHTGKFGVKDLRKYVDFATLSKVGTIVLVYGGRPSSYARTAIREVNIRACLCVEEFSEARMRFNVTHHELVPAHSRVDEAVKQCLLKRYGLDEGQLPRISSTDPVARYYGLKPGEVVRIVRRSESSGRCATYRLVHAAELETARL